MSAQASASRFSGKRQPNFENFRRTILRKGPPGPVPFVELFADPGMVEAVLGERFDVDLHRYIEEPLVNVSAEDLRGLLKAVEMYLRFSYEMGYDYVAMVTGLAFRRGQVAAADTAAQVNWAGGLRYWQDESGGPIQTWEDFEAYPWPHPEDVSYAAFEFLNTLLPDGMKMSAFQFGGVFENATWLMGLERFSYALRDDPALVEAICERVGELTTAVAEHLATIDNMGILFLSDDMGFYSGTLVSPDVLRRYVLPHYKKMAEAAHRAGKLFLFHSCGNMYKLMDDLIDDVGIDAKHSFEDKILPVDEAYRRWGDRIALLGGVDMDLLGRGTEEQVRARTRQILETCGVKGMGYGLGTGNTAANYIPVQNYLAMLDEGRRWNREHFGAA